MTFQTCTIIRLSGEDSDGYNSDNLIMF